MINNFSPIFSEPEIALFWNILIPLFAIITGGYIAFRIAEIKGWFKN